MNADPFVDPDIVIRIENELALVERDFGVRILLAVESGSRAWRFPSRDSDHDVRFIYLETIENYLTVMPRRDVIERPPACRLERGFAGMADVAATISRGWRWCGADA
jgi:hypothetical protein